MKRKVRATGKAGDWKGKSTAMEAPASAVRFFDIPDLDAVYAPIEHPEQTEYARVMESIRDGKAEIADAKLFCGRFSEDGRLLREANGPRKPYRIYRTRTNAEYREAMEKAAAEWGRLPARIDAAEAQRAKKLNNREAIQRRKLGLKAREDYFQSSSDLGSLFTPDPNQYTAYTPIFSGPWGKAQYYDYFVGHARAFELYNHNPIAHRVVDLFVQYIAGRGFKVRCKKVALNEKWSKFNRANRITYNLRKFWLRETLICGENFIDVLRWISVDPSTIYEIICEGFGEFIDKVLYYQQMFQSIVQEYTGIAVPGVPKSKASKIGKYIIRQIPYDQIIHVKYGVTSWEKRGRSLLYPIMGLLKELMDTLRARILGEQLKASFVWDDTIEGTQEQVDAHAAQYNYIPVAPSIFVHNKTVERKPLSPLSGGGGEKQDVIWEIVAIVGACLGIPKDHLNVMVSSGGSRATAIVGSEPFTKVIEDGQEDCSELVHRIIEEFCRQNGEDYEPDDWQVTFPSVVKDSLIDRLKAIALCKAERAFSQRRAATMMATEMDADDYDYDDEMKEIEDDLAKNPPVSPFGAPAPARNFDKTGKANDLHDGKQDVIDQHKDL